MHSFNTMRSTLLALSMFVAALVGGTASAQTAYTGTCTLQGTNYPGLQQGTTYPCTVATLGGNVFMWIDGVNFSACNIVLEFIPPPFGNGTPIGASVSCRPYWGTFTLFVNEVSLAAT